MRFTLALIALSMIAAPIQAEAPPDAAELTHLLQDFLAGASHDDAAVHDRFWADDLIYTGSSGRRIGKADIMKDVRESPPPKPTDPKTIFTAEDIRIQQYGNTAIVAFRLVGTTDDAGRKEVMNYLNTGTFVKREGKWQAAGWQATKMPRPEDRSKSEVTAVEAAFHRAILSSDVKALESSVDESFVWTGREDQPMARKQLLESLTSGELKYTKLETSNVTVFIYGDTAVVRGRSLQQRSADANPVTVDYTLTFGNKGDGWKAIAMHSSRRQEK